MQLKTTLNFHIYTYQIHLSLNIYIMSILKKTKNAKDTIRKYTVFIYYKYVYRYTNNLLTNKILIM